MSIAATLASHRAHVSAPIARRALTARRSPVASRARGRGLCARAGTVSPVKLDENVDFYQVRCMIRPWRLNDVVTALENFGIRGLTTYDVMGAGVQAGAVERYQGASFDENTHSLVAKKCVEVVLEREQVLSLSTASSTPRRRARSETGRFSSHPWRTSCAFAPGRLARTPNAWSVVAAP